MHTCCTCLLLNATSTHSPSICPSIRPHLLISALFMHLPTALWASKRAPATHFLGARILITLSFSTHPAALISASRNTQCLPPLCKCTVLPIPLSTGPYLGETHQKIAFSHEITSKVKMRVPVHPMSVC